MVNRILDLVSLRIVRDQSVEYSSISGPSEVVRLAAEILQGRDREYFLSIHLDSKIRPLSADISAIGTANSCMVSPSVVFRAALVSGAVAVVFAHCHPSGDPTPSPDDIELTKVLLRAGRLLDVRVLDHLVIGDGAHVSIREQLPHLPWEREV